MPLKTVDAKDLAKEIKKHASESNNEEDIKIRIEHLLRQRVFDNLKIPWAQYEHTSKERGVVSGGRKDALYGTVIIEYKSPGELNNSSVFKLAKEQIKKYIREEAKDEEYYNQYFGIIIDGRNIAFVRYRKKPGKKQKAPVKSVTHINFMALSSKNLI